MDLKQQLVIWKRAGFLLDNVALSPTLLDNLMAGDVITPAMAGEIQVGHQTCEMVYTYHIKVHSDVNTSSDGVAPPYNHRTSSSRLILVLFPSSVVAGMVRNTILPRCPIQ